MEDLIIQERDPALRKLASALKAVKPPEPSVNDWLRLENRLLAELSVHPPRRRLITLPHLPDFLPARPVLLGAFALLLLAVAGFLVRPSVPPSDAPIPIAHIVKISGGLASGVPGALKLQEDLGPVFPGRLYRAHDGGQCLVQVDPGTGFLLQDNGEFTVAELSRNTVRLDLKSGSLLIKVSPRSPEQSFIVTTPNAECRVVGTQFKVEYTPNPEATVLTVFEGKVRMRLRDAPARALLVRAGEAATARKGAIESPVMTAAAAIPAAAGPVLKLPVETAYDAARPHGTLVVATDPPGAEVSLNGAIVGVTPLTLRCAPGSYTVALHLPGFASATRNIDVAAGGTAKVRVSLEKLMYLKLMKGLLEQESSLPVAPATRLPAPAKSEPDDSEILEREYQIALHKMETGETRQAATILEDLLRSGTLTPEIRITALEKQAACYRSLGDYPAYAGALQGLYATVPSDARRDNLLWEIANLQASNLEHYDDAEASLLIYMREFTDGFWIEEAGLKYAEIQYLLRRSDSAALAFGRFIRKYPDNPAIDKAIYNMAYIMSRDLADCSTAGAWYARLESGYPNSAYLEDAIFWHGDCLVRTGQSKRAEEKFRKYQRLFPDGRWKETVEERVTALTGLSAKP